MGDTTMLEDRYVYSGPPDHGVNPADRLYILERFSGTPWKMQITSYDKNGVLGVEPHHPFIRWGEL